MKSIILSFVTAILHFVIGLWLSTKSFGHAVAVYATNRELNSIEKINYLIVEIMFFPIVTIFESTGYEGTNFITQYFPFILNSALWGILIVYGYNIFLHKGN